MKNWWEGTLNMWTPAPFAHLISVQFIGFIRLNIPSQDSCGKINFKRLTTSNAAHYSLLCSDLCSVVSSRAQTEIAVYKYYYLRLQFGLIQYHIKSDKQTETWAKKEIYYKNVVPQYLRRIVTVWSLHVTCSTCFLLTAAKIHSLFYLCLDVFLLYDVTEKITMVTRCRLYTKDINNLFYKLFLHILSPLSYRPDIEIITTSYIHDYSQNVTHTKT